MKKLLLSLLILFTSIFTFGQGSCAAALNIAGNGTITAPAITGTYFANCFPAGPTNAIWYNYTPTVAGNVTISSDLPANVAPNNIDTRVSVTAGACTVTACTASNDDISATNYLSTVTFAVAAGTTYNIQWDNRWDPAGFDFTFNFTPISCFPVTTIGEPTSLTTTSATLNWTAPSPTPAQYEVEYGLTGFVQGSTGGTIILSATNSIALSGLVASATYDYYIRSRCSASDLSTRTLVQSFSLIGPNGEAVIYNTSKVGSSGAEISATANGAATSMGDAIVLSRTERYLKSITARLFSLVATTPYTVTMSLYTNCPTVTGAGACGSGVGTLIAGSSVTVSVTPSATVGIPQDVVFNYPDLNLTGETDNTITVMINASRNNVLWIFGEKPTVGAMPAGETGLGVLTRCGSTGTNNGCTRNFGVDNNFQMRVVAVSAPLTSQEFNSDSFTIFPNPIADILTISNNNNYNVKSVSISDLNGRIVKIKNFDSLSDIKINMTDLSSGMYIMNINTNQGTIIKKVIKE